MVLARNDGILPLDAGLLRRVALIGPNAAQVSIQGGGSAHVSPAYVVTPLQGLASALEGQAEIVHAPGVLSDSEPEEPGAADDEIARAAELSASVDVAIVIVGTSDRIESEGFDRTTLALPGCQAELVEAVLRRNPRTVVVVNSGAPVELPWLDQAPATLLAWFPGQEAGHALADVLTGAVEPGGRMPTNWPRHAADRPAPSPVPATASFATPKACTSAIAPGCATTPCQPSHSAPASATRPGASTPWPCSARPTARTQPRGSPSPTPAHATERRPYRCT
jgi:hypothetical protein